MNRVPPYENARQLVSRADASQHQHDTPLLVDSKHAAAILSIGQRKLWELTNCQAIPSRKIGRSVRYCIAELKAWITAGCPTQPGSADRVRRGVSQ